MSELIMLFVVMLFTAFIIWVIVSGYSLKLDIEESPTLMEGLETMEDKPATTTTNGESGNATNYAAKIKAMVVKIQDELLISKYRQDYENIIVNLDDLISFSMIKQVLDIKTNPNGTPLNMTGFQNLNILKNAKDSLNVTMSFLDKQ
jgi:hypothetical protein